MRTLRTNIRSILLLGICQRNSREWERQRQKGGQGKKERERGLAAATLVVQAEEGRATKQGEKLYKERETHTRD